MKKILLFSSLLVMALTVSCGQGGSKKGGAKDVADKFIQTFYVEMDLAASRQFVSPELLEEFPETDQMSELEKHFVGILQEHAKSHRYEAQYDAARSEIGDDSANIFYMLTAKGNPAWTGEGEVELVKDADGKWIVADYGLDRDEDAIDFGF